MQPPTPSTSSVAPISSGATSWTLRAKRSVGRTRVVADERGDGKGDDHRTEDAGDSARADREAHARKRGHEPRLDIPERGRRRDLRELDPRDAAAERVRRHRPE